MKRIRVYVGAICFLLLAHLTLNAKNSQIVIGWLYKHMPQQPEFFVHSPEDENLGARLLAQVTTPAQTRRTQTRARTQTQRRVQTQSQIQSQTQSQTQTQTQTQTQPLFIGFPMELAWKLDVGGPIIAQPQVDSTYVYCISKPGNLCKAIQGTGKQVWRRAVGDSVEEAFLLQKKVLYVGGQRGVISAWDTERGREIWTQQVEGDSFLTKPATSDESLYFVGLQGNVVCLNAADGSIRWKFKAGGQCHTAPFLYRDLLFLACDNAVLYALDAAAGFVKWNFSAGAAIMGSPIADQNHVFFGSEDTYFYCISREKGQLNWKFKTGGAVRGVPMFYQHEDDVEPKEVLLASFDNFLYNLRIKNGGRKWLSMLTARVYNQMHFDRALIFIAPFGSTVLGYDPHTGERAGEFSGAGRIRSSPITTNDLLFLGLNTGDLIALKRKPPPPPETEEGAQTQTQTQTQTQSQTQTESQTQQTQPQTQTQS